MSRKHFSTASKGPQLLVRLQGDPTGSYRRLMYCCMLSFWTKRSLIERHKADPRGMELSYTFLSRSNMPWGRVRVHVCVNRRGSIQICGRQCRGSGGCPGSTAPPHCRPAGCGPLARSGPPLGYGSSHSAGHTHAHTHAHTVRWGHRNISRMDQVNDGIIRNHTAGSQKAQ